jgi:hypothetical protein
MSLLYPLHHLSFTSFSSCSLFVVFCYLGIRIRGLQSPLGTMSTMTTISFLALSNILSFAFANPVAPAAPVITPRAVLPRQLIQRQDSSSAASSADISVDPEDGWIGYYQNTDTDVSTAYTSLYCGGSSIFTTSVYSGSTIVGCCVPGYCTTDLALTCSGTSAVYSDESGSTSGWAW